VYERLTPPEQIADIETAKFIEEGKEIFHSPDKLGGTIGVSCDMCHPDAVKTHPETYPKYQTQLQRVARLRDMINWCIENPVKASRSTRRSVPAHARGLHHFATQRHRVGLRQALSSMALWFLASGAAALTRRYMPRAAGFRGSRIAAKVDRFCRELI
jgi:hypothetical protein